MCETCLDEIRLVSEVQIAEVIRYAFREERLILEGAGACDTALLLDTGAERFEQRFAVIYSGDNIDPDTFLEIVKIH